MQPGLIPPPPPQRPGGRRRPARWPWALGGVAVVALLLLIAAHRPILRWLIEDRADRLGLSLRYDDLEVGLGEVRLTGARIGLRGQSVLSGETPTLRIALGFFSIERVTMDRGRLAVIGPLPTVATALARWRTEHGGGSGVELAATAIALDLRDAPTAAPWLSVTSASATPTSWGGTLTTRDLTLFGAPLGAQSFGWSTGQRQLSLWLGDGSVDRSPARLELLGTAPPAARLVVRAAPLTTFTDPLGLPSVRGATLDAQVDLAFPSGQGLQGKMQGSLRGLALPGAEWSSLVLSAPTAFGAQLVGTPDGTRVQFQKLTVQNGALVAQGTAELQHQGGAGALRGRLDGQVPCGMFAQNMAASVIGGGLGELVGAVAGAAIGGAVTLNVTFDFDTRAPRNGQVRPVIGVGCGLRGVP